MLAPVNTGRRGFTLIELIVVMAIIILLAGLTAAYWPDIQNARSVNNATDQVSQWLLTAKQRAKRDGLPTGLRLIGSPLVTQLQYVQQPDDLSGGFCIGTDANNPNQVNFTGVDFQGGAATLNQPDQAPVQPGDYLELFGGGVVRQISSVVVLSAPLTGFGLILTNPPPVFNVSTPTYRILRAPRPLAGEEVLTLQNNMAIDLSLPPPTFATSPYSLNVPTRGVLIPGNPVPVSFNEIMFSPTGTVIGQGTSAGKVILWLRDSAQPLGTDFGSLITIQIRSGFIGASPIAPFNLSNPLGTGNDPYLYTEDGRSSGM